MIKPSEVSSLEILYRISRELTVSLDLHTVLEHVLTLSTSNIGAERASLIVLGDKEAPIDAAMILNGQLTPTTIEKMKDVLTSGLAGWVIRHHKLALLNDAEKDERWLPSPNPSPDETAGKSVLCIPIMAHEKLVGVLTIVHSQLNFFTKEYVALQQAIADMAGIAIRNAELYKDVQNAQVRYYDLFEESIEPIFVTDLHGKILEANRQASQVTGITMEKLLQYSITDLHRPDLEKIGQQFENIPAQGSLTYDSELQNRAGEVLPVEVHVSQILIAEETCAQWIFRNLTEQKKLDQLRDNLSAMLYHDLRSPLANIVSSLDILTNLLPLSDSDSIKSVFEVAKRSTGRMQRMIDGLLDINRLESGQQITQKHSTHITALINESVEIIHSTAESKEIEIAQDIGARVPDLSIDEDMIRRVLVNLLENAIKFSPSGSTVHIGAKKYKQEVHLWVDDHGSGIPEDSREEIFEKFVRLQKTISVKGLGLGLAFCKLAVQAHGGTIWVENRPQGGSRFIFSLPIDQ